MRISGPHGQRPTPNPSRAPPGAAGGQADPTAKAESAGTPVGRGPRPLKANPTGSEKSSLWKVELGFYVDPTTGQRKDDLLTDLAGACSPPGYLDPNPLTTLLHSVTVESVRTTVRFETGVFRSDLLVWEGVTNRPC